MKKFSFVYMIVLPYLLLGSVIGSVKLFGNSIGKGTVIVILIAIVLLCSGGVAACIVCNVASLMSLTDEQSADHNLTLKLAYLPAHFCMLMLMMGMFNPFLLWASWLPILLSWCMIAYSGFGNIGACVNLLRHGKCSLKVTILLCVLSFCFVGDIVGAALQSRAAKKTRETQ